MGKKDTVLRSYFSNPEIFADLFNGYLFQGEQVLEKDAINPLDTSEAVLVKRQSGESKPDPNVSGCDQKSGVWDGIHCTRN